MLNILVVEDFDVLRDELVWFLNRPGWQASGVGSGAAMDDWLQLQRADIVLLDLNLPDEDGLSIARRLRQRWPMLGIVMLTARALHAQRAAGFSSGADVYLNKPAQTAEIEAVIRNLQRRIQVADSPLPAPTQALQLDARQRRLVQPTGAAVELSEPEVCLLLRLARSSPGAVSLAELLQALADAGHGQTDANHLRVRIARLRSRMQPVCGGNDPIPSVRGQGYRLALPLRQI